MKSIFDSHAEYLVNPVNCVGVMGKGLALEFKKRFPDVFQTYAEACRAGKIVPGRVQVVGRVVNFPTKRHWRDKSRMLDVAEGLIDLVCELRARGAESVAIPALGCGEGGLSWMAVKRMIVIAFENETCELDLYGPR